MVGFSDIKKIPENFKIEVGVVIKEFNKIISEMNITGKN